MQNHSHEADHQAPICDPLRISNEYIISYMYYYGIHNNYYHYAELSFWVLNNMETRQVM